jgi:hypothetical protein
MRRTKTQESLADAERAHAGDPERAEVLRRARTFKASWVELGEVLSRVKRNGDWKKWGYDSFESYAQGELFLRPQTVEKLTGSFAFLQRRAPSVLARDGIREAIPSYQAVDFLRRAEAKGDTPPRALEEMRRKVIDEVVPASAVTRAYREVVFPIDENTRLQRDRSGLRNVAKRLRELLAETQAVPATLADEVTGALDALLAAVADSDEVAA